MIGQIINNQIDKTEDFKIENIGEIIGKIKKEKKLEIMREPILRKVLCEKYKGML